MDPILDAASLGWDALIGHEWLAINGLGGYASSTAVCCNTRKHHGLLVAAMAPPGRRMVLLSRLEETVHCDGWPSHLASNEYPGTVHPEGHLLLRAFSHEPFPRWAYQGDGWTLEKSLCLLRGQNMVCISYTLLGGDRTIELELRPLLALRGIHDLSYQWNGRLLAGAKSGNLWHVPATSRTTEVFLAIDGAFQPQPGWYLSTIYRRDLERGYAGLEDLWTPGSFRALLAPGRSTHFVCSTDRIELADVVEQARVKRSAVRPRSSAPASAGARAARAASPRTAVEADLGIASEHLPALDLSH